MADYPSSIYLRPPLFDGDAVEGGGLNAAVRRLDEVRDEVVAIETELGALLKGDSASLSARLATRLARNGIPRGQMFFAPSGPWYDGTTWMAFGKTTRAASNNSFDLINFGFSYLSADPPKIVLTSAKSAHATDKCAWALTGRILTTGFYTSMARRNAAGSTLLEQFDIHWWAIGGTPA